MANRPIKHKNSPFTSLGTPKRVWAISAIHCEVNKLIEVHDQLFEYISPGDRIIYLGNYIGRGDTTHETIEELLTFRRMVLAKPGMMTSDITYLRGQQEYMWQKLMELHYAPNPVDTLLWMYGNGLRHTIENYGLSVHDGIEAAKDNMVSLARWIGRIQDAVRKSEGHREFYGSLRRAAFTQDQTHHPLLFVHAGINPQKTLDNQGDSFWWSNVPFEAISEAYDPFGRVVRGFDPKQSGVHINCVTASIDGGCGFGGDLIAAGFAHNGEVVELMGA